MLQLARALQRIGAEVHVLSLNPRKQRADVEAARRALAPVTLEAIDIDTGRHVRAALRSVPMGVPQVVARFYSPAFAQRLAEILRETAFDVVIIESPSLLPYVRTIREASSALVVLRALNVEFRIWEQLARNARNPVRRAALHVVARSLRRYELAQLNACDAVVPITADDGRDFRALGCERPMHVLPGGVQPLDLAEGPDPRAIYFLGSLDYRPNQEAALWIARELLPRLARRAPEATLHLGGSNGPRRLREQLVAAGVSVIDDVPDAAAFARPMGIMIAPLFAGGGMRIKILEAMALGKPVVSTSLGAAGIDVTQGSNILLADDAETFGDAVAALVRDPLRARQLGAAGRRLVEERYDATALTRELLAFLEELLQSREIDRRHRA